MLCGPKPTVKKARRLRRTMTKPEVMLWQRLGHRPGGFKFRRQHPAGPYVLDFFCSDSLLAIEIDGIAHELGGNPAKDEARDSWLREQGLEILRLRALDVLSEPDQALEWIVAACDERRNPLHQPAAGPPPRSGEENL